MRNKIAFAFILIGLLLLPAVVLNGQVNTEKFRVDKDEDNFEVKVGLLLSLRKGNMDIFRVDSNLGISYNKGKNYLFLVGNLTYNEKNKAATINKGFAHLRGIRRLSKRVMLELFTQQEFNEFILLKSRTLAGAGVRYLLYKYDGKNSGLAVNLGVGAMWEGESFDKAGDQVMKENTNLFKATNYLSFTYECKTFTLGNVTYLQFNMGKEKSTRLYSDIKLNVKLSKKLSWTSSLYYRRDNNPPMGVKNYDLQLKNGLTLTL